VRSIVTFFAVAVAVLVLNGPAQCRAAGEYPHKAVRLVVPYPAGGPLDVTARVLAQAVRDRLGTVLVENRPGAGGNIGAEAVARAAPDGYTLLLGAVATHAINQWIYPKLPYDPVGDFAPITLIASVPNVLVMNETAARGEGVRSVADFIAYLQRRPQPARFASGGSGSAGHLAGELFKAATHTDAIHVPYRGAAPAQLALLSGDVEFMFDNLASAAPAIRDGRLRALAVTTRDPAASFPELPTLAASGQPGLKDFDVGTWFGLFAPARTPQAILTRLVADFTAALGSPAMREQLGLLGTRPAPLAAEQFAAFIAREAKKYEKVARQSGATVD